MENKYTRITSNPGIMGNKPIIRGHRFRVVDVLQYLAAGDTRDKLREEFDFLEDEDITEALAYAAEVMLRPKPELDALQSKTEAEYQEFEKTTGIVAKQIL